MAGGVVLGRVPITVMGYRCERCEHEWVPRNLDQEPKVCPECKSPYWNRSRKRPPMDYSEFRDTIRTTIEEAGKPLTWTEIRTEARLPQMLPNNGWVRRMESDINLLRQKDTKGIILWSLGSGETA
jgi:hypothetical protein